MADPNRIPLLLFFAGALATLPVAAVEPEQAPDLPAASAGAQVQPADVELPTAWEPLPRWLDDVRAQRHAWEERRRAAKEAIDERRRQIDPWGAAEKEARDQEVKRRREAFRERIARDRELFRAQGPWSTQHRRTHGNTPPPAPHEQSATMPGSLGESAQKDIPVAPDSLPGWDNPWYYRGY